jgi:YD repeat-containing protein
MKEIKEYDKNNNLTHYRDSNGYEYWSEYDEKGNEIHYRNSEGYEWWREYDEKNNCIHYRDTNGYEWWNEYDENNNLIHYHSNGYEWYDENGNEIAKPNPTTSETERAETLAAMLVTKDIRIAQLEREIRRYNIHEDYCASYNLHKIPDIRGACNCTYATTHTMDDKEYYKRERKIHEKFDKAIRPHKEMFESALKQIQYEYDHAIKEYRKVLHEELQQLQSEL